MSDSGASARVPVPRILLMALGVNLLAVVVSVWMYRNAFILIDETAPLGMLMLAATNVTMTMLVARRIVTMRAVNDKRRFVRVDFDLAATINGQQCTISDLSLGGCQVSVEGPMDLSAGDVVRVEFQLHGASFELESRVRGVGVTAMGKTQIGISFLPGQNGYIERLAIGMLSEGGRLREAE